MGRAVEFAVAPMMEYTDRHFRYLARLLSKNVKLYTEMVVDQTILNQQHNLEQHLGFNQVEKPLVLQLGGSSPNDLRKCAEIGEAWGYDEINLNVGCPSPKVCGQCFGARLMLQPDLVRQIVVSMQSVVNIPVTVKCRLGVDKQEEYDYIRDFVSAIPECEHFIIHARNCLLNGISPHKNRTIPPLKYDYVYKLTEDFPDKQFTLNGGIKTIEESRKVLDENPYLFGIMVGRAASNNTAMLSKVDSLIYGDQNQAASLTRRNVVEQYLDYCDSMSEKSSASNLLKPLSGLTYGCLGSSRFRKHIHEGHKRIKNGEKTIREVINRAIESMPQDVWDERIENITE